MMSSKHEMESFPILRLKLIGNISVNLTVS